jgi:oligopeptidase B
MARPKIPKVHLMRNMALALVLVASLPVAQVAAQGTRKAKAPDTAPVAVRKPVSTQHHGIALVDDYAWMRTAKLEAVLADTDALEAPIRAHLDAENAYAKSVLAPNRALERRLVAEMKGRVARRDRTVPDMYGPWQYYYRYEDGSERKLHCRQPREGGPEQVILDENKLAAGRRGFSLGETTISPDHKLLAYSVDEDGSERSILKIRDLATGRDLADSLGEVRGDFVWSADGQWLFYVRRDPVKWGRTVYRHKLGTPVADDLIVHEESEEGFTVSLRSTLSDRFLVIESSDFSTTDLKVLDLTEPASQPFAVTERAPGHKWAVSDLGDRLIFVTNADGAIDWKIGEKVLPAPVSEPLREIVPHVAGRVIEDVIVYAEHLVWLERDRERGTQRIRIRRWADGVEHDLTFGEQPAKVELQGGLEQTTRTLRYSYQSLAQPRQVFDYDMETRQRTLRKVQEVPGGFDPARYVTRRIEAPANDGAKVPVTVFYRATTQLDGSAPVWLHGYGAYGDTESPDFGTERLSLVDRGFIYAIAHVRGGGEKGEAWHEAGRLGRKATTFTDYIAVAEELVRARLTRPGRIVASGASAGGTLVGTVANLRPDLFGAIYAEVPFVDALNTLLDRSLPLTESSFSEFGNPIESKADFLTIQSYSPYDNVRAQAYPPVLAVQSVNDPRVPYWEAAKWVAKLRQMKTDANPVLLYINMQGGHGGGTGRFENLEEFARAYAFALRLFGR